MLKLEGCLQGTSQCTMRGSSMAVAPIGHLAGGMRMLWPSAKQHASQRSAVWASLTPTMMRPIGMFSMSIARSEALFRM